MMKKLSALALCAGLMTSSGCYLLQKPAPKYDPAQTPASQAATFVGEQNTKKKGDIKKIAVTSCNVMIGQVVSGTSQTHAGLGTSNQGRVDAKVTKLFYLRGISDEQQQALTEDLCRQAEAQFKAAGYEVVSAAELEANEHFKLMQQAGKPAPYEIKQGQTSYKLYAPKGQAITNIAYLGTGGALASAFKAAAGTSPLQHEGRLMDSLKADAAHVDIFVDFASVEGDKKGFLSGLANKDSASVKGTVGMTIRGRVQFTLASQLKCWTRFGKHECASYPGPQFGLKVPLTDNGEFVAETKDETSKGDKVAGAVTSAIGMLAALGGGAGGMSVKITRTGVHVDPANFAMVAKKAYGFIIEMQTVRMKG